MARGESKRRIYQGGILSNLGRIKKGHKSLRLTPQNALIVNFSLFFEIKKYQSKNYRIHW